MRNTVNDKKLMWKKNPLDPGRKGSDNKQRMCIRTKRSLPNVVTGALVLIITRSMSVVATDQKQYTTEIKKCTKWFILKVKHCKPGFFFLKN